MRRRWIAVVSGVLALLLAACGGAATAPEPERGPAGVAFYTPPKQWGDMRPGDVLRYRPYTGSAPPDTATKTLVMYRTSTIHGAPVPATGVVYVPRGKPPKGGWPVIAADHGTIGWAPECAPSRIDFDDSGILDAFVHAGFVVELPDYQGMGVTGQTLPYLIGKAAAHDTLDLVRAAHRLNPQIGTDFLVYGHSEGAHAALWTADTAPGYAPELRLHGVVALAPGRAAELMPPLLMARSPVATEFISLFLAILKGASAAYPDRVREDQVLTPVGIRATEAAWHVCAGEIDTPPVDTMLLAHPDFAPIIKAIEQNDPIHVRLTVPTIIEAGTADPLYPFIGPLVKALCQERTAKVLYKVYPGQPHNLELDGQAGQDLLDWIHTVWSGGAPPDNCGQPVPGS